MHSDVGWVLPMTANKLLKCLIDNDNMSRIATRTMFAQFSNLKIRCQRDVSQVIFDPQLYAGVPRNIARIYRTLR